MLPVIEYSVDVPASGDETFRTFQDLDRLLGRGIYEEAAWVEGLPWEVGSRLRYVITHPFQGAFSAVLTAIDAPRSIDLLSHGIGITTEQHVSFSPDLKGGTRIRMTFTLVGKSDTLSESELQRAAAFLAQDALDTVVALFARSDLDSATGT